MSNINRGNETVESFDKETIKSELYDYLFSNLQRAVSELYTLCEYDSNDIATEEVVNILNSSVQDFDELKQRLVVILGNTMTTNGNPPKSGTSTSSNRSLKISSPHKVSQNRSSTVSSVPLPPPSTTVTTVSSSSTVPSTSSTTPGSSSSLARASKSGISWEVRQVNTSVSGHHRTNSTPHKTASQLVIKRLLERMTEEGERSILMTTINTADSSMNTDTSIIENSPNMDDSLEMHQPPLVSRSGTNNSSNNPSSSSAALTDSAKTNDNTMVSSSDEETPAVFARGGGIAITTVPTSHHPRTPGRTTSTFERASPSVSRPQSQHHHRGSPVRTSSSTANPVPIGSANRSNTMEKNNVILDDRPAPVLLLLSQLEQGGLSWGDWMLDDDKVNARMGNPSDDHHHHNGSNGVTMLKLPGTTTMMNRTPSRSNGNTQKNDYDGSDTHSSTISSGENGTFGFSQGQITSTSVPATTVSTAKPAFSWFSRRDTITSGGSTSTNPNPSTVMSSQPPTGKTLHQKLSSPERQRPSPQETAIRSVQRQAAAEAKRQTLQEEKMNKLMEQNARVRDANQRVQARQVEVASSVAEKLEAAEARHNQVLQSTRQRAGHELAKVSEARISQRAEIENRKASMQLQMEEADRRRNQVIQQRLAKVSGHSPKVPPNSTDNHTNVAATVTSATTTTTSGSSVISRPRDSTISYASALNGSVVPISVHELEQEHVRNGKDETGESGTDRPEPPVKGVNLSVLFVPVTNVDTTANVSSKTKKRSSNKKEEQRPIKDTKDPKAKRTNETNVPVTASEPTTAPTKPTGPVAIPTAPTVNPWKRSGTGASNESNSVVDASKGTKPTKKDQAKSKGTLKTSSESTTKAITPPESPITNTNPWETVSRSNHGSNHKQRTVNNSTNTNGGTKKNTLSSAVDASSSPNDTAVPIVNKVSTDTTIKNERVGTPLPGVGNGAVNTKALKPMNATIVPGKGSSSPPVVPVIDMTVIVNRVEMVSNENDLSPPVSPNANRNVLPPTETKATKPKETTAIVTTPPVVAKESVTKASKKGPTEKVTKNEPSLLPPTETVNKEIPNGNNAKVSAAKKKKLRKLRSGIFATGTVYGTSMNISVPTFPDSGSNNPLVRSILTLRKLLTVDETNDTGPTTAPIDNDNNTDDNGTMNGLATLTHITSDIENAVKETWRIMEGKPLTTNSTVKTNTGNGTNKTNDTASYSDPLLVGMAKMHMSTLLLSTLNNTSSSSSTTDGATPPSSSPSSLPLFRFTDTVTSSSSSAATGTSTSSILLPITSTDADMVRKSQIIHLLSRCISRDTLTTNPRTVGYALRTIGLACTLRENRELALSKGIAIPIIDIITTILNDFGARVMERHPRTIGSTTKETNTSSNKTIPVPVPASAVPRFDTLASSHDITDAHVSILLSALETLWLLLRHEHTDSASTLSLHSSVLPTKLNASLVQVESSIVTYILGTGIIQQMGEMFRSVRELPTPSQIAYTPLLQASLAVLINICNRSMIDTLIEGTEYPPVYTNTNSTNNNSSAPYREALVHALCDTGSGLLDIPSLIISLVATCIPPSTELSSVSSSTVSTARLDPVVLTTATLALQTMNSAARLDLVSIQTAFNHTNIIPEIRYAFDLLLTHLSSTVMNSPSLVPVTDALVHELVLLVGYLTYDNPPLQDCLHYGANPPTLLHRLCNLPFRFFREPVHVSILIPSLLCAIDRNETNKSLLLKEMAITTFTDFIEREQTMYDNGSNNNPNLPSFIRLINRIPMERWLTMINFLKG